MMATHFFPPFSYRDPAIIIQYTFSIWFPFASCGEDGDCGSCQRNFFLPLFLYGFYSVLYSRIKFVCLCEPRRRMTILYCLIPLLASTAEKKKQQQRRRKLWIVNSAENKRCFHHSISQLFCLHLLICAASVI